MLTEYCHFLEPTILTPTTSYVLPSLSTMPHCLVRPIHETTTSPYCPLTLWSVLASYRFNQCFGVLGLLDRLHNTDDLFRSTGVSKRNVLLLGWTPAWQAYPLPSDAPRSTGEKGNKTILMH